MVKQIVSAVRAAVKLDRHLHKLMPLPGIPHIEIHSTKVPKAGFRASAWRGLAQLMGRSATTVIVAKPFGMLPRFHPFNIIPAPSESEMSQFRSDLGMKSTVDGRVITRTLTNRRTSQQRDGPSILSQRTSKSPSAGKRRRRCSSRSKSGKPCLRPRGHSGRHRYQ